MRQSSQTLYILLISTVMFTISQTKTVTITYNIERTQTYDVILNVTSVDACAVFVNTEYHDNQCRCMRNHMFFVVEDKAGCYQAKQINPQCSLIDQSSFRDLLAQRKQQFTKSLTSGDTTLNCTQKVINYNSNGKWMYLEMPSSILTEGKMEGKLLTITYECNKNDDMNCRLLKFPGHDQYIHTFNPTTSTVGTNISIKTKTSTTITTKEKKIPRKYPESKNKNSGSHPPKTTTNNKTNEQKETRKKLMIALVVCAVLLAGVVILAIIMARRYLKIKKMTSDSEVARLHSPPSDENTKTSPKK
ncbi:uncharacterized protein [Clytia hemisphaerica]|uniref:Cnidarian restricted protein n=1 Tax=Clytia hemisphaerica TaxID=252671 RepID=A0A7M5XAD2_9CNID